jgi:hypothetical protein
MAQVHSSESKVLPCAQEITGCRSAGAGRGPPDVHSEFVLMLHTALQC